MFCEGYCAQGLGLDLRLTAYAFTGSGVLRSVDNGVTWSDGKC